MRKTQDVIRELAAEGCTFWKLVTMIRSHKIPRPGKDSSGDYVFNDEDLERVRVALRTDLRRKAKAAH